MGIPTLVNEGKVESQAVCDGGGPFCAACVRADDDCVAVVGDVMHDVALQERTGKEVVD